MTLFEHFCFVLDQLDRLFVDVRNLSRDETLGQLLRVYLLELVELRASRWVQTEEFKSYFKSKVAESSVINFLIIKNLWSISILYLMLCRTPLFPLATNSNNQPMARFTLIVLRRVRPLSCCRERRSSSPANILAVSRCKRRSS